MDFAVRSTLRWGKAPSGQDSAQIIKLVDAFAVRRTPHCVRAPVAPEQSYIGSFLLYVVQNYINEYAVRSTLR